MPKMLRFKHLESEGIPYTRKHIDHLEKNGQFPVRVHLGPASVAWLADEVRAWVAARIAARTVVPFTGPVAPKPYPGRPSGRPPRVSASEPAVAPAPIAARSST